MAINRVIGQFTPMTQHKLNQLAQAQESQVHFLTLYI